MTDIVERLRALAAIDGCQASIDAADEITRLRAGEGGGMSDIAIISATIMVCVTIVITTAIIKGKV